MLAAMHTRLAALAVSSLLLLALVAPAAQAKAPPKGTYECVIGSSSLLFGSITIKSGGKYRYSRFGKTGTFKTTKTQKTFSGGHVTGYGISFKGGGLNKFKGYWFTSTTGTHEIALAKPKPGAIVSIYCDD
jgi:hypothetical protein